MRWLDPTQRGKARGFVILFLVIGASAWFGFSQRTVPDPNIQSVFDPETGSPATKYIFDGAEVVIPNQFIVPGGTIEAVSFAPIVVFRINHPLPEPYNGSLVRGRRLVEPSQLERVTARIIPGPISETQFEKIKRIATAHDLKRAVEIENSTDPEIIAELRRSRDIEFSIVSIKKAMKQTPYGLSYYDVISNGTKGSRLVMRYYIPTSLEEQSARPAFTIRCDSRAGPSLVQNCRATFNFFGAATIMYNFAEERISVWREIENAIFRIARVSETGT